jgi:hypothetical protein
VPLTIKKAIHVTVNIPDAVRSRNCECFDTRVMSPGVNLSFELLSVSKNYFAPEAARCRINLTRLFHETKGTDMISTREPFSALSGWECARHYLLRLSLAHYQVQ